MYELCKFKAYKHSGDGLDLLVHLPDKQIIEVITNKHIRKGLLVIDDGRCISAEQRKKAYATIKDISEYTGYLPEEQKECLKYLHIIKTGCEYFSLSNCTMDTAREFINTILDFALETGIPLSELGLNRTDDIGKYLYACTKHHKCAICGQDGEIHHWDAIGMGNNRLHYDDSKNRKICLCRKHHSECHTIGRKEFEKIYKVYGIIIQN